MPPIVIRYDRQRLWRSTAVLWAVGTGVALVLAAQAGQGRSLLARLWAGVGAPPALATFLVVEGLTLAACGYAAGHALRRADLIRLLPEGLEIEDSYGKYRVAWDNIAATGKHLDSFAGVRLKGMEPVLASHVGTAAQRQLLATREPFGEYDIVFSREQLDCGVDRFLADLEKYRQEPASRSALAG